MRCPHVVWALRQRGLSASERVTLIYLADRANGAKVCWPTIEEIAEAVELSPRTIHTAVHRLHDLGLIRIKPRFKQSHNYLILRPDDDLQDLQNSACNSRKSNLQSTTTTHAEFAEEGIPQGIPQEKPKEEDARARDPAPLLVPVEIPVAATLIPAASQTPPPPKQATSDLLTPTAEQMQVVWNEAVAGTHIPRIEKLTNSRRTGLFRIARDLCEDALGPWRAICREVAADPWCRGENPGQGHESWTASIDWILRGDNALRYLEKVATAQRAARAATTQRPIEPPEFFRLGSPGGS